MTLDALALKYGTDKDASHHDYCRIYEQLFPHPEKVQRVLEIGILYGASLRMWADWFPNAQIVGMDNILQFKGEIPSRIALVKGDSSNSKDLEYITTFRPYDLIVDDGSHFWAHIITAFEPLFLNALAPGGFYVIEDLHVCWRPQHFQQGCPMNPMDYFKELVDKANWNGLSEWNRIYEPDGVVIEKDLTPLEKWIEDISFRKGLVIVRKAKR